MARQTLINSTAENPVTFGEQRTKINDNFTELYENKVDKETGKSLILDTEIQRLASVTNEILKGTGQELYDKAIAAPTEKFQAIWAEYNKLVIYDGNGVFRDAIGATVIVYTEVTQITVTSVEAIPNINVAYGSAQPARPATASVTLSDNSTVQMPVTWGASTPTYNDNTAGTYAYVGTLTLPQNITNPLNRVANVNVVVAVQGVVPEFEFTLRTTVLNEEIYVPVTSSQAYNMTVDWGDGTTTTYNKLGVLKELKKTINAPAGTDVTIKLTGTAIPQLNFSAIGGFTLNTLRSINKNTLTSPMTLLAVNGCTNLVSVSGDMYQNITNQATISFFGCSSLTTIGSTFGASLAGKGVTRLTFQNCTSLVNVPNDIFANVALTTAFYMFAATQIGSIPTSLREALATCTNLDGVFAQTSGVYTVPNNLFDLVQNNSVTIVNSLFTGVGGTVTGDAKVLYDVLLTKVTAGANTALCFSRLQLTNRNQVPTAWGGSL